VSILLNKIIFGSLGSGKMKTLYIKIIILVIIKFEKSSYINSVDKKIKLLNKIILGSLQWKWKNENLIYKKNDNNKV
jgi:hypothetical protein